MNQLYDFSIKKGCGKKTVGGEPWALRSVEIDEIAVVKDYGSQVEHSVTRHHFGALVELHCTCSAWQPGPLAPTDCQHTRFINERYLILDLLISAEHFSPVKVSAA